MPFLASIGDYLNHQFTIYKQNWMSPSLHLTVHLPLPPWQPPTYCIVRRIKELDDWYELACLQYPLRAISFISHPFSAGPPTSTNHLHVSANRHLQVYTDPSCQRILAFNIPELHAVSSCRILTASIWARNNVELYFRLQHSRFLFHLSSTPLESEMNTLQ